MEGRINTLRAWLTRLAPHNHVTEKPGSGQLETAIG